MLFHTPGIVEFEFFSTDLAAYPLAWNVYNCVDGVRFRREWRITKCAIVYTSG